MHGCACRHIYKGKAANLKAFQCLLTHTTPEHTHTISLLTAFFDMGGIKCSYDLFAAKLPNHTVIKTKPVNELFKTTAVTLLIHPAPSLHITEHIPAVHPHP